MARVFQKRYDTVIVTRVEDIPDDYKQTSDFCDGYPHVKPATLRKALSTAHKTGTVRAVKLVRTLGDLHNGPVLLHPDDATAFLDRAFPPSWQASSTAADASLAPAAEADAGECPPSVAAGGLPFWRPDYSPAAQSAAPAAPAAGEVAVAVPPVGGRLIVAEDAMAMLRQAQDAVAGNTAMVAALHGEVVRLVAAVRDLAAAMSLRSEAEMQAAMAAGVRDGVA